MLNREECLVKCEKCGRLLTAKEHRGLFKSGNSWDIPACPGCSMERKEVMMETVYCPVCGKRQKKTEKVTCIACGSLLVEPKDVDEITCPDCHQSVLIPAVHQGAFRCYHCNADISEAYIKNNRKPPVPSEKAQYILLPTPQEMNNKRWAIWKYPASDFSFKSRMQVSEGTFGLLYQNGACKYPCGPGSYALAEYDLSMEQKLDMAVSKDDIPLHTDIYCVLQKLPEIVWGVVTPEISKSVISRLEPGKPEQALETPPFEDRAQRGVFKMRSNGRILYSVCDPQAFMEYVGHREIGFHDLIEFDNEMKTSGMLLTLTRKEMNEALYNCVRSIAETEQIDLPRLKMRRPEVTEAVTQEMNARMARYGLWVEQLEFKEFQPEETEDSVTERTRQDTVLRLSNLRFDWKTDDVQLHKPENKEHSVSLSFSGVCQLHPVNKDQLFSQPEIQNFLNQPAVSEDALRQSLEATARSFLKNQLPILMQEAVDQGRVADIVEMHQYPRCAEVLKDALNQYLAPYGLGTVSLIMSLPQLISMSDTLKQTMDLDRRIRDLELYLVKSPLRLQADAVRVHMKEDPTVYVMERFSGNCQLRVADREKYFSSPEAKGFLHSEPFVSHRDVLFSYEAKLNPLFNSVITSVAQAVVDQTNADIQELNRLLGILQNSLLVNLNERVNAWGLSVESVDLNTPVCTETSSNFQSWKKMHETRSGIQLENEINRMINDQVIYKTSENGRVEVQIGKTRTETEQALAAQKSTREALEEARKDAQYHQEKVKQEQEYRDRLEYIRREAEIKRLLDETVSEKKKRDFEAVWQEYKQQYTLREEEINQSIHEEQLRQQGQIDKNARERQAEFEKTLAEASNKQLLSDILRKISESELDWKKKLNEYERLGRLTDIQDQADKTRILAQASADVKKVEAETDAMIQRENNEVYYVIGSTKIKLREEEAQLLERIAKFDEDRQERQSAALEQRNERRAILNFEQRMSERQAQLAQNMELLALKHKQEVELREKENALAEKENELKKLQYILDYQLKAVHEAASVEQASRQAEAQEQLRKAEAQYESETQKARADAEKERLAAQLRREDETARRAEEFQRQLLEIQKALEMTRLENERRKDEQKAQVELKQAETSKDFEEQMDQMDDHLKDLYERMKEIQTSVASLSNRNVAMANPAVQWSSAGSSNSESQEKMNETLRQVIVSLFEAQQRTAKDQPPIANPIYQPAMKRCPNCTALCPATASRCYNCNIPFVNG